MRAKFGKEEGDPMWDSGHAKFEEVFLSEWKFHVDTEL